MVREARFCWDDSDGPDPLDLRRLDDFDDEDDGLLDPDPPEEPARERRRDGERRRRKHRRAAETDRRHLAGADWLSDGPLRREEEAA